MIVKRKRAILSKKRGLKTVFFSIHNAKPTAAIKDDL